MLDFLRRIIPQPPKPPVPKPPLPASTSASPPAPAPAPKPAPQPAPGNSASSTVNPANPGGVGGKDFSARKSIEALTGKGDSAYMRLTGEANVQGNFRLGQLGGGASAGSDIRVTRNSDKPDSTYTVRFDKQTAARVNGEIGTDTVGKGKGKPGAIPGAPVPGGAAKSGPDLSLNAKADVGGQVTDTVEMTFANKEDAIRATQTIERLQKADVIDDAISGVTRSIPGVGGIPGLPKLPGMPGLPGLPGLPKLTGGENPVGNPLNKDGEPGALAKRLAGVNEADMAFLKKNVTAYEQSAGTTVGLGLEGRAKGVAKQLNLAADGRIEGGQRFIRRTEVATADKPGTVTYSVEGKMKLSAKDKAGREFLDGALTLKGDNRMDLGEAKTKISLTFDLPKGGGSSASAGGRPVPEAGALSGDHPMLATKAEIENKIDVRTQSLGDKSRADASILTEKLTIEEPARLKEAAGQLFSGKFEDAARTANGSAEVSLQTVKRSGFDVQPGIGIKLPIGKADASVIITRGVDDVTDVKTLRFAPPAQQPPQGQQPGTRQVTPPAPKDDGQTYTVVPHAGVNIRETPNGKDIGDVQSGSFLRGNNETRTDESGAKWLKLKGTDEADKPVEGWVRSDLVRQHSSATGAMDGKGRINPSNEYQRFDQIKVEKDDNLWDLSQKHGWDPKATIAANKDHINNPSLVFKGDTVYVPGSARGPAQRTVPVEAAPQPKVGSSSSPSGSSVPGAPSGSNSPGSTSRSGSGSTASGVPSTGTGSGSPTGPVAPGTPGNRPATPAPTNTAPAGRPSLDSILRDYQVAADPNTADWKPKVLEHTGGILSGLGGLVDKVAGTDFQDQLAKLDRKGLPANEVRVLDKLGPQDQVEWAMMTGDLQENAKNAYAKPPGYQGDDMAWGNDGHVDAYRHALWNAKMTQKFGEAWTKEYATAHEQIAGNPPEREAMDLHNNEVGRRIATENPNASDAELETLVKNAVARGDMVVVDRNQKLAWSDQVGIGQHGQVNDAQPDAPANPRVTVDPDRAETTS